VKLEDLRRKQQGLDAELQPLKKRQNDLEEELEKLEVQLASINKAKAWILQRLEPHRTTPETLFLDMIVTEFHRNRDEPISKLEKILRLILEQNMVKMDLVLFFDALDEFNGHLNLICRFLKDLVEKSATSATRVKVCFSSRPWDPLEHHFSSYPGFDLQDHTKSDIEEYAAGSLASLKFADPSFVKLISARAEGVFLWARLAINELFDTIATKTSSSPEDLEQ
jgi:hypothetical protein